MYVAKKPSFSAAAFSLGSMLNPREIKTLLAQAGLRPRKGLAQHFLVDPEALGNIVAAGELCDRDVVVEVGPGLGTLTWELAKRASLVVALELDEKLCELLRRRSQGMANLVILQQDVLAFQAGEHLSSLEYKVIANLPYYLATAAVRHFLESELKPKLMVVTVQKEVAQSMVASPGSMGLLGVSTQFYGRPEIIAVLPPGSFYPPPRVESAVVRIDVFQRPALEVEDPVRFFQLVRAGFTAPRKQLRNSLARGLALEPASAADLLRWASLDGTRRAETLSLKEWETLYQAVESHTPEALGCLTRAP